MQHIIFLPNVDKKSLGTWNKNQYHIKIISWRIESKLSHKSYKYAMMLKKRVNKLLLVGSLLLWIKLLWSDFRAETFCIFSFVDFLHSHPSPVARSIARCCIFLFFFLSKQHGETLQGFWFLLLLCHCHIILTDTEEPWQPAACKILSIFKFDLGFEAGAQLRSWRESACQGKSLLHGKNSPGITPHLQRCGSGTRQGELGRRNSEEVILI